MSAFISVGVDGAGNVYPATLTAYPATAASGAGANLTIAPQAAATGASGSVVVNVAAPASGTVEAGIFFERGGTKLLSLQPYISLPTTYAALYGGGVAPTANNYFFAGSADGTACVFNATTLVTFAINAGTVFSLGSTGLTMAASKGIAMTGGGIGGSSGTPFVLVNSSVTLGTSGTTSITAAQQGSPNLTIAAVTLTGAAVLDFGNVTGNFQVNIVGVNAASFASHGLSFKNGTTTTALPSTALTDGGLVVVRCDTNAIAFCV